MRVSTKRTLHGIYWASGKMLDRIRINYDYFGRRQVYLCECDGVWVCLPHTHTCCVYVGEMHKLIETTLSSLVECVCFLFLR